jgi:hypothetical protein
LQTLHQVPTSSDSSFLLVFSEFAQENNYFCFSFANFKVAFFFSFRN